MMKPMQLKPPPKIRGEPIDLDTMLDFAIVEQVDIESAIEWWDDHASPDWIGALDAPQYDDTDAEL